nr:immunoglobulin light chain junction region [Macaca mulatta]MOV94967.1 immunoglobulin light chain junction region [Macaca mulatta]MOV94999.1 immunoglobulin light chain junction region [Macaca mulatta]MOV95365.1 immunoglobulin light chain junction region [Macaca mulatta]MOV95542.1 immunoglobulin light chain junction region [Macaca mulatta]
DYYCQFWDSSSDVLF